MQNYNNHFREFPEVVSNLFWIVLIAGGIFGIFDSGVIYGFISAQTIMPFFVLISATVMLFRKDYKIFKIVSTIILSVGIIGITFTGITDTPSLLSVFFPIVIISYSVKPIVFARFTSILALVGTAIVFFFNTHFYTPAHNHSITDMYSTPYIRTFFWLLVTIIIMDISTQTIVRINNRLSRARQEEEFLRKTLDKFIQFIPENYIITDEEYKIVAISDAFKIRELGIEEDIRGIKIEDALVDFRDLILGMREISREAMENQKYWKSDITQTYLNGKVRYIEVSEYRIENEHNNGFYDCIVIRDLTDITLEKNKITALLENAPGAFSVEDENYNLVFATESYYKLMNMKKEEVIGKDPITIPHYLFERKDIQQQRAIEDLKIKQNKKIVSNISNIQNGAVKYYRNEVSKVDLGDGKFYRGISTYDLTDLIATQQSLSDTVAELEASNEELEEANSQLNRKANHDALTGVLSRRGFFSHIEQYYGEGSIIIFDLDFFKSVNDSFGHSIGDRVLIDFSDYVNKVLNEEGVDGVFGRMGGEEFIIWINANLEDASTLAEQIRSKIQNTSFEYDGVSIRRTASFGVAFKDKNFDLSHTIDIADKALGVAKQTGKNKVITVDAEFINYLKSRGELFTNQEIVDSLLADEIQYYLQPIIDSHIGRPVGFEALLRWERTDGIEISPEFFGDRYSLAIRENEKTLRKSINLIREVAIWIDKHFPDCYLAINIDIEQLSYKNASREVLKICEIITKGTNIDLVLELSERAINSRLDIETIRNEIKKIKSDNEKIKFALDDFGKESSNLYRLAELPIDIMKIDMSITKGLSSGNGIQMKTLIAISLLSRSLKIPAVIEGVELRIESSMAKNLGVNLQQGFFWSKPKSINNNDELLRLYKKDYVNEL